MEVNEYDLVVIGSGPAGQKGAICAAKLRKKVAIIDRKRTIGGVCVRHGSALVISNTASHLLYLVAIIQCRQDFAKRSQQLPQFQVDRSFHEPSPGRVKRLLRDSIAED
jgi:thioredoxin reductase